MPTIRPERPADHPTIHALHAAAFPTPAEARLVDLLRDAGHLSISLVAEHDNQLVGHIAFSPVTTAAGHTGAGLAPLAVLQSHRNQGIAAALVEAGLEACRGAGFTWAVVLGAPHYYGRFGFQAAPLHGLTDEYGGADAFQVLALIPNAIPTNAGLVRYAPEFASL